MNTTLHILNGDSTLERFPKQTIQGNYIVFREMLCEGPVSAPIGKDAFWTARYDFFENEFNSPRLEYFDKTIKPLMQIQDLENVEEITLWFENDLFCQANLIGLCTYLLQYFQKKIRYCLVCTPKPLSHYSNEQLATFYEQKTKLSRHDLVFAEQAWQAYAQRDKATLKAFDFSKTRKFRFLAKAMEQELQRFGNGENLNQIDQKIVALVAQNITEKKTLIQTLLQWQEQETIYGFGDVQYEKAIEKLIENQIIKNIV